MKLLKPPTLFSTLKAKLTAWHLASIFLMALVLFVITAAITQITLYQQIDHHIHIVVNEAQRVLEQSTKDEQIDILKNFVSGQGMTVVVLSPDGAPILETNSPDVASVTEHQLLQVMSHSNNKVEPQHFTVDTIRFASLPIETEQGTGIVAIGYSTKVVSSTVEELLAVLGASTLLLLIVTASANYWLVSKSLTPLDEIAATANTITNIKQLQERIEPLPNTTELKDIARGFNNMLGQLQNIFEQEHEFFSDTAHNLKTPLAVLRSNIESTKSLTKHAKEDLLLNLDNVVELTQNLLLLSRTKIINSADEIETVDLSSLVENLAELARALGESKNISIETNIDEGAAVMSNQHLLARAIGNLIHNAVEHTPSNGTIEIGLTKVAAEIVLTIKDSGKGITKDDLPHIFQRFYQGQNKTKQSTGLGLAITKAVIENAGGTISASSKGGAVFTVILPAISNS